MKGEQMPLKTWAKHVPSTVRHRITAVVLAGAIIAAPLAVVNHAASQLSGQSTHSAQSERPGSPGTSSGTQRVAISGASLSGDAASRNAAEKRIPIGPIISWIKKNAGWLWDQLVKAVKSGWENFLAWWNGLAGWIRAGIVQVAGASAWEIFQALLDYLT